MLLVPHVAGEAPPEVLGSAGAYGVTVTQNEAVILMWDSQKKGGNEGQVTFQELTNITEEDLAQPRTLADAVK